MDVFVELIGWIAALLTLAAYAMRTMLPLRVAAIGANVFFAAYGWFEAIYPTLVLHLVLLPFNSWRLAEILRMERRSKAARAADKPLDWIAPLVRQAAIPADGLVFRKGDPPDRLYYLKSGKVRLEEIGVELEPGEIFGEIAFFTEAQERTLTARCVGRCEILALDERDFLNLYYQNPAFGMYVIRLVTARLLDGIRANPAAYLTQDTAREPVPVPGR